MKKGSTENNKQSDLIRQEIAVFKAITWCSCGDPSPSDENRSSPGWVKFGLQKNELGWRTLEFLAWVCTDMTRAGERLCFFPTAPPPYLNTPGDCLSFVLEVYPLHDDYPARSAKVAEFIQYCRKKYWPECRP
jgi:hypothetical protein